MHISKKRHVWELKQTHGSRLDLHGGNQTNWIRPKNIRRGRRLLLAFTRSIGLLDPCRPRGHEGLPCITYVLLVTISIAMTQGLGQAQTPVASQEPAIPFSTTANDRSRDNQLTSIHEPSDQMATSPCRLQVQATFAQPSAKATEAMSTIGTLHYTPLSTRCPTHSCQQTFRRPGPRQRTGGRSMVEVCRGGRSGLARLLRIRNRADSSRRLLYRRSCKRIHATFRRASERSLPGFGIRQPESWSPRTTTAIVPSTRPSSWAFWPPLRYRMPTPQDMIVLSGIP